MNSFGRRSGGIGGNVKLRGKKTRLMNCGCCVALNIKEEVRDKEQKQEVKDFLRGLAA